jgi:hypothetical protein
MRHPLAYASSTVYASVDPLPQQVNVTTWRAYSIIPTSTSRSDIGPRVVFRRLAVLGEHVGSLCTWLSSWMISSRPGDAISTRRDHRPLACQQADIVR